MKLVSFSVQNFRSITQAHKLPLADYTVLVGPNNEGKSNLLKALATAMRILTRGRRLTFVKGQPVTKFYAPYRTYDWENDFPIGLQRKHPDGESVFVLEFLLNQKEVQRFKKQIKSSLNGTLPIRIALGPQSTCKVTVAKKGPGGPALTAKSAIIAAFVADQLQFEHIQAVRTAESAESVIGSLVDEQLASVESNPEYKQAIEEIAKLQRPVLDQLSNSIKTTMVRFLPAIRNVTFELADDTLTAALRRAARIVVDDGSPTYLAYKGDGVQSLAALALMRYSSETSAGAKNSVIAVEEPESHLHPNAIHGLKAVLRDLAGKNQVVITTHCPVFVDRSNAGANIIVKDRKARTATSIDEIRRVLGVRASDNMRHAELVLLVEGEDDREALHALLSAASSHLRIALNGGALAIEVLGGGSNVAYKASLVKSALCECHAFLDYDRAGVEGATRAQNEGILLPSEVTFASCLGAKESELEDLYEPSVYESMIYSNYNVSLQGSRFKGPKKWSDRLKETFKHQGQHVDDKRQAEIKAKVATLVAQNGLTSLNPHKRTSFDRLVATLEIRLNAPQPRSMTASAV